MGGAGVLFALIGAFLVWASIRNGTRCVVGIVSGAICALGAVGLTLIYGVLKFGHFAHGDAMMMSALRGLLLPLRPHRRRQAL